MNSRRVCFPGALLLCVTAFLPALGNRENDKKPEAPVVQASGVVRLVGTALFPELVITGSEKEWYVPNEEKAKLHDFQHRTVTVEGEETVIELKFASGFPAGVRRELRNIKVIAVE